MNELDSIFQEVEEQAPILNDVEQYAHTVIYGAGNMGRQVLDILRRGGTG